MSDSPPSTAGLVELAHCDRAVRLWQTSIGVTAVTGRAVCAAPPRGRRAWARSPHCLLGGALTAPIVGAGRPRDLDRVVDVAPTACAEQPSARERRQSVGMSGTDPRVFSDLGHASEPRPAGTSVRRPSGGLIPARILNPCRGPENRAHRGGVAIPVAVGASLRRADAEMRVRHHCIEAVRRSMAPKDGRVTGALRAGETGVDDFE
jgi:hypothetical protein